MARGIVALTLLITALLVHDQAVYAQTPGPNDYTTEPLVSLCDVMQQLAQASSTAMNNTILCTSSAPPNCNTINCNVLSNQDRLQFQVLQCSSPPSVRAINRASNGTTLFDHTFSSSESVPAMIGGGLQQFSVTLEQYSGLVLGIEVIVTVGTVDVTFVPYQRIPVNTTCGSGTATPPPTCQVTQNIAQYTMVTAFDTANCTVSSSCFEILCRASNAFDPMHQIHVELAMIVLPCSKPPSFVFGYYYYRNGTEYYEISNITDSPYYNVTLDHLNSNLIGLEFLVHTIEEDVVIIPYVRIPLGLPESCEPTESLVTLCDITPLTAQEASAVFGGTQVSCFSSSPPNCDLITCTVLSTNDQLQFQIRSCTNPPSLRVINRAENGTLLFQHDFDHSDVFTGEIGGNQTPLNVTIGQFPGLALALEVVALVQTDTSSVNVTFVHYRVFPLNTSACTRVRTPMCHAMDEIAQYVMVSTSNNSANSLESYANTPNCTVGPEPCNETICVFSDNSNQSFSVFQCLDPPEVRVTDSSLGLDVTTAHTVHDNDTGVTVILEDKGGNIIGLEVDKDGVPYFPYIIVPLNTSGCPRATPIATSVLFPPTQTFQPSPSTQTYMSSQAGFSTAIGTATQTRQTSSQIIFPTTSEPTQSQGTTTTTTTTTAPRSTTVITSVSKSPEVTNQPRGGSKVALGVGVSVAVVGVVFVLVLVVLGLLYWRHRNKTKQYEFQPMSFSDMSNIDRDE